MPKILFKPHDVEIEVAEGENLLRAAIGADILVASSCGGAGTCKKCKAKLSQGDIEKGDISGLDKQEAGEGYFLLCQAEASADAVVEIPLESIRAGLKATMADKKILDQQLKSASNFEDRLPKAGLNPAVKTHEIQLKEPTIEDFKADLDRVKDALNEPDIQAGLEEVKDLPGVARKSGWNINVLVLEQGAGKRITGFRPAGSRFLGVAVDVGTTTIVAELVDLQTGEVLKKGSRYNAQIAFGDDVITRIVFAGKGDGRVTMQKAAVETINELITDLCKKQDADIDDIALIMAAGNTTMAHLLLGLQPKYIREYPYVPAANYFPIVKASEVGLDAKNASLYVFPSMASYIGGDIIAGLMAIDITNKQNTTLFIDVGTNGEMVLGNAEWMLGCACSAGPAFEGGGVKDGMRATKGAIELVRIDRTTYEPTILTIGKSKPVGICGSGLIDAIAELYVSGALSPNGKFEKELIKDRLDEQHGSIGYILCNAEESGIGKNIVLTESDIDNLIRAKGAVFSGMMTLLNSVGLSVSDIDEVLIAGAFGNYLDIEKTITIGLLPDLPLDKFSFVGNGSLLGARLALLSKDFILKAEEIAAKLTYMDLSSTQGYMDMYMSALFLPHTDITLFPTVNEKLLTP